MRNHYLRKNVKSAQRECVKDFCAEKKQHFGGVFCCQNAISYFMYLPTSNTFSIISSYCKCETYPKTSI